VTDLYIWPQAWLPSPIVKEVRIDHSWTLLTLENNDMYLDIGYDLIPLKNEGELQHYLRTWRT
jgi:hypothetical protein